MSVVRSISWVATTLPDGTSIAAGVIIADAVVEERGDDETEITDKPVENGSVIQFNAFRLPSILELTYAFSPGGAQNKAHDPSYLTTIYQKFLSLDDGRVLLTVMTGKRQYQNMLIKSMSVTTDANTENILLIRLTLKALILTTTQTVNLSSSAQQGIPGKTASPVNNGTVPLGSGSNFNSGTPAGS